MEIVKHKQDMANKLLPGAMVIYLSICRHRDLNLLKKSFSKVAEDPKYVGIVKRLLKKVAEGPKLEILPQPPPDLPPTDR